MSDHASTASSAGEDEEPTNSGEEGLAEMLMKRRKREMRMQGTKREMVLQRMKREMLMQRHSNLNLLINLGQERGQSPSGQMTR